MNNVLYLFLRRMRFPLVLIIGIYAITVTGLALVPGVDDQGNPTEGMGLFNAFYVISYTGTTIGFGELPHPYSVAQRLWMTFSIYLTVIGWSYSVVTMISLVQDPLFQSAMRAGRFARRVKRLHEPFYIVCGVGETGSLVCHGLDRLGLRFVVVDANPERLQALRLEDFHSDPPMAPGDAAQPATLTTAGLLSPHCRGVMALAVDDATNRAIAVTVRLLAPGVPVMARVGDPTEGLNMGAFGGDFIANPFERFAQHLAEAVATPEAFHLREILTGLPGDPLPAKHRPPRGHWIMCGYGRFGHRIREYLEAAGLGVTVIDKLHYGEPGVDIEGTGTDAPCLMRAGITISAGIVAGNANDLKNLAIALIARELNPGIFIVTRQNQLSNQPLFDAFSEDLPMQPSRIVAREFLALITTPLLGRFIDLIPERDEDDCARLSRALGRVNRGLVPEIWSVTLDEKEAPAVTHELTHGRWVNTGHLLVDPFDRSRAADVLVLMVSRGEQIMSLPATDVHLAQGDRLLLAGSPEASRAMSLVLNHANLLDYVRTGRERHGGWVWQALDARRRARARRRERGTPT